MAHLQHIIVAILMVLDVKLEDGDGDAAASRGGNIPDTLSVFWVSVGVVWAVEGATRSRELPSTTCTGTNNPGVSHKGKEHLINPNTDIWASYRSGTTSSGIPTWRPRSLIWTRGWALSSWCCWLEAAGFRRKSRSEALDHLAHRRAGAANGGRRIISNYPFCKLGSHIHKQQF